MNELPALLTAFKHLNQPDKTETDAEYRLYYNQDGSVLTMTHGEHPESDDYIVITQEVYERPNYNILRVVGGKLMILQDTFYHQQYLQPGSKGYRVVANHANLLVDETYQGETQYYEFKNH